MTRKKVREKYDLGESKLRGFIKNTKKLFETFNSSSLESAKRKRQRDGGYPELEDAVTLWISSSNVRGSLPSKAMICKKAAELATQMGLDFNPSESWLRRMRIRNNIGWKKAHGEKQNADAPAAQVFIDEKLPLILEKYDPNDIFNRHWEVHETSLFSP